MTEPSGTPRDNDDDAQVQLDELAAQTNDDDSDSEVIEPGYSEAVAYPEQEDDPVTRRQTDPAAMSEHERNLRQTEQYGAGL